MIIAAFCEHKELNTINSNKMKYYNVLIKPELEMDYILLMCHWEPT